MQLTVVAVLAVAATDSHIAGSAHLFQIVFDLLLEHYRFKAQCEHTGTKDTQQVHIAHQHYTLAPQTHKPCTVPNTNVKSNRG